MSFELRLAQIMYVESMNHKLVIHHDNGDFIEKKKFIFIYKKKSILLTLFKFINHLS